MVTDGCYLGTPFHAGRSIRMGALHNGSVRIAPFNAGLMRAPLLRLSLFSATEVSSTSSS